MARIITKIGDMFSAKLDGNNKKYMQYVANDLTQLNSDVIRVYKYRYAIDSNPDLSEVVKGDVDFYAHCVITLGIKLGCWEKVGKIADVGKIEVLFRGTNDYGHMLGEEPVKISNNWFVWKINDERYTRVGKLMGEYQNSEIGIVVNPVNILNRMNTGKYDFVYPGYEE